MNYGEASGTTAKRALLAHCLAAGRKAPAAASSLVVAEFEAEIEQMWENGRLAVDPSAAVEQDAWRPGVGTPRPGH